MNSPFKFTIGKHAPSFVSVFDSATDMIGATSSFLRGEVFEGVGTSISSEFYSKIVNNLPNTWKQKLYTMSGKFGATSYKEIGEMNAEEIDRWIYNVYPDKKYPAIAIGSSNGALVHLYAAMGIPWLPQTILIPLDKGEKLPTDEPIKTMNWGIKPAETFLRNNPDWQIHHMMDPNQDRLRVGSVAYFRIKKRTLGKWYEKFIRERLAPSGKLIIIDCQQKWPVSRLSEKHVFQFGGLGGIPAEEYYDGSERIHQFLKQHKSKVTKWETPAIDEEAPEAEWGFAPHLLQDISSFAEKHNLSYTKITFDHPQEPSPLIADLYRWWYPQINRPADCLLVESFAVQSPLLALQKGCIPYWLFFSVNPAADRLKEYLQNTAHYHEILMMILSHGKESIGSTPIEQWKHIMKAYAKQYDFIGTDASKYPLDLAVYARYSRDLKKKLPFDYSMPAPLTLSAFENFTREWNDKNAAVITARQAS